MYALYAADVSMQHGLPQRSCFMTTYALSQVCAGLRQFVPREQLQGRLVVAVCNLKPAKLAVAGKGGSCPHMVALATRAPTPSIDDDSFQQSIHTPNDSCSRLPESVKLSLTGQEPNLCSAWPAVLREFEREAPSFCSLAKPGCASSLRSGATP
eukprot:1149865-Pelagomonas_calceolata.AAC.6